MTATARFDMFHGRTPVPAAWPAGGRLHRYDSTPNSDRATTYIPVPKTGVLHGSWRVYLKLNVLTHAPASTLSNLRFFFDGGTWDTGITVYVALSELYSPASRVDAGALITGGVAANTYTAGSPLSVYPGTFLSGSAVGYGVQPYIILQAMVASTVVAGISIPRTMSYQFDEA